MNLQLKIQEKEFAILALFGIKFVRCVRDHVMLYISEQQCCLTSMNCTTWGSWLGQMARSTADPSWNSENSDFHKLDSCLFELDKTCRLICTVTKLTPNYTDQPRTDSLNINKATVNNIQCFTFRLGRRSERHR